jgi:hypothetical protein
MSKVVAGLWGMGSSGSKCTRVVESDGVTHLRYQVMK